MGSETLETQKNYKKKSISDKKEEPGSSLVSILLMNIFVQTMKDNIVLPGLESTHGKCRCRRSAYRGVDFSLKSGFR